MGICHLGRLCAWEILSRDDYFLGDYVMVDFVPGRFWCKEILYHNIMGGNPNFSWVGVQWGRAAMWREDLPPCKFPHLQSLSLAQKCHFDLLHSDWGREKIH